MEDQLAGRHPSRVDTDFYKGVGILLIVLHNYFHWVRPSTGENEFTFNRDRTLRLFEGLSLQPLEAANLLLDYFGHYGVQIFVFLSAYGLARTYSGTKIDWPKFLLRRVGRIYPTFVLAVLAHLAFVVTPWNAHLGWYLKAYLLTLSGLSAFVPNMQFSMVGPWWFFSLIFQFYAVFPLLNMLSDRRGPSALLVVGLSALALTTVGNLYLVPHGVNLYATVLGHLPVLCLGIHLARADALEISPRVAVIALVAFLFGLWSYAAWLIAPLCVTLMFLFVLPRLASVLRRSPKLFRFIAHCGAISLPLFAIHGMMRLPFVQAANSRGDWLYTIGIAALFVLLALAAAQLLSWVERNLRQWIVPDGAARA